MRVLLVNPSFRYRFGRYQGGTIKAVHTPPLGLLYVAASTRAAGHDVRVLDMTLKDLQASDIERVLREIDPDVVGIAASMAFNLVPAEWLASAVKACRPQTPVVFGGIQTTFLHRDVLARNPAVDVVVRFEGDETFPLLLEALGDHQANLEEIPGITFRSVEGEIVETSPAARILDLDQLPHPARDLVNLDDYPWNTRGIMMTSRGCPYGCSFCSTSVFNGKKMRYHSVGRVVDEIRELRYRYGVSNIVFGDDTFTVKRRRVLEFCEEVQREGIDVSWGCDTRADLVDDELLREMKKAGLSLIFFGVEAVSQDTLNAVGKKLTVERLRSAIDACKRLGIQVIESFIIGLPFQTYESVDEISSFVSQTRPDEVLFNMLIVYPGTDMYENPSRYGIVRYSTDWIKSEQVTPMVETKWMNAAQMRQAYVKLIRNLERDFPQPRAISLFEAA
jgi:anaerobic magnesium-protoporphyrin IX monomethyl ester cyclase